MFYILLIIPLLICSFYTYSYFSLKKALKHITNELDDIQLQISENRILHLPIPDRDLERLLNSINQTLISVRHERITYAHQEKVLKEQIENISHDLRTPLSVIRGYLKLLPSLLQEDTSLKTVSNTMVDNSINYNGSLQKNTTIEHNKDYNTLFYNGTSSKQLEIWNILERKSLTMENLLNQFYQFTCITSNDYDIEIHPIDINRILKETLMDNYKLLNSANIDVDILIPEHPLWIYGCDNSVERIISNLIQNASRYALNYFIIKAEETNTSVIIHFINNTSHLSSNDISHLFDRFFMQNNSRNNGGSGLGLTIAKELAGLMDGTLEAMILETNSETSTTDTSELLDIQFSLTLKKALVPTNASTELENLGYNCEL